MSGWSGKRLDELCSIEIGRTPARDNPRYWDTDKQTDNVWVSIADMGKAVSASIHGSKEHLSDAGAAITPLVPEGALLLSFKLSLGKLAFAGRPLRTNEAIAALIPNDVRQINKKFLYWYFHSFDWVAAARGSEKIKGVTLNKAKLKEITVPLPSLPEQKRIVATLDEAFEGIDAAVANAEKNIVNARELFENYLNAALSRVDGWVDMKIGDANLLQIIDGDRGTNYPSKTEFFEKEYCLFLNTKNVRPDGFNFSATSFITKEKDSQLRKGKLKRRDVVLTTRGTIGNIALYDDAVEFDHIRINSGMLIFRPNERVILSEYLFEMLRSGVVKSQITQFVSGAAQPQLPIHTLSKFSIPVPKVIADQKQIVDRLRVLSNESKRLEGIYQQKLEGLAELKQSILNKAFSGGLTAASAESLVKAAE